MSNVEEGHPQVAAQWAVRSKTPGQPMGYALMLGSGDRARAGRLIQGGGTGTPSDENDGRADALPWISFVADATGAEPVLGVLIRSWSEERDGTGQTIVPSRLLLVPWPEPPGVRPGFTELLNLGQSVTWSGVDGIPNGTPDGSVMPASVSPIDVDLLVRTIDEIGFDWLLAVAVALLDGEQIVIVMGEEILSLYDRVRVLDAVCALLPYGCRSWISAATWARDRSKHGVRLSFAASARDSQREIPLTAEPYVDPRSQAASEYHREMKILRSRQMSVSRIVAHLAAESEPVSFDQPTMALHSLQELRFPEVVCEEVRTGRGNPVRVDELLSMTGWRGLDEVDADARRDIACFLADAARAPGPRYLDARDVLRHHWGPEPLAILADEIARDLRGAPSPVPRDRVAAVAAASPEARAELVAEVLKLVAPAIEPEVAARTIDLLRATHSLDHENPRTWQLLATTAELGARLLRLARPEQVCFSDALARMEPHEQKDGAEWLRYVRELLQNGRIDPAVVELPDSVLTLLFDLACVLGEVVPFLTVAWRFILRLAYRGHTAGEWAAGRIVERITAEPAPTASAAMASIDLLSLGAARTLPFLRRDPPSGFLPALAAAWLAVPEVAQARLARDLPAAVLNGTLSRESFDKLDAVLSALGSDMVRKAAVVEVGNHLVADPDTLPALLPLSAWWIRELTAHPAYAWIEDYVALRDLARRDGVGKKEICKGYRGFREHRGPAYAAVRLIEPWLAAEEDGCNLLELLWWFGESSSGRSADFSKDTYALEIQEAVFAGYAGPSVAAWFLTELKERRAEVEALEKLTSSVMRRGGLLAWRGGKRNTKPGYGHTSANRSPAEGQTRGRERTRPGGLF